MPKKIYLSPPHMGGTEQKYVTEAFDTNWIAPLGPNVDNFEKDLYYFYRCKTRCYSVTNKPERYYTVN